MKIKRSYLTLALAGILTAGLFAWDLDQKTPVGPTVIDGPQETATTTEAPIFQSSHPSNDHSKFTVATSTVSIETNSRPVKMPYQDADKEADRILTKNGKVYPLRQYKTLLTPNDTYATQWWTTSNNMPQVWDIPFDGPATTIAIIDTGFALNHQEFSGRWATNSGEQGATDSENSSDLNCTDQDKPLNRSCNNIDDNFDGVVDNEVGPTSEENPSFLNCTDLGLSLDKSCNRIDDDGNGYIDDWRGWDFVNFDASAQAGEINPDGLSTDHGTMVAGVAAASGNNSVGLAGVNWHSKILPLQALSDDEYGDSYTVANAVYYAADQGADVISLSLGTSSDDPYMREAVEYAISKGSIVVAATGNDGCDCITYPAKYPEVIAVGASDSTGDVAYFTSYGSALDIIAPGQGIATSTWTKNNGSSAYVANAAGTSFATPFVSGMLGLARNYQPDAHWDEIVGAMFEQANRSGLTAASPRNNQVGYGHTEAYDMLNRLRTPANETQRYTFSPYLTGSTRAYQCQSKIPATPFYEITKSGQQRYSAGTSNLALAALQGWNVRQITQVCMGLPTDQPDIIRSLNLPAEISNKFLKQ